MGTQRYQIAQMGTQRYQMAQMGTHGQETKDAHHGQETKDAHPRAGHPVHQRAGHPVHQRAGHPENPEKNPVNQQESLENPVNQQESLENPENGPVRPRKPGKWTVRPRKPRTRICGCPVHPYRRWCTAGTPTGWYTTAGYTTAESRVSRTTVPYTVQKRLTRLLCL